MNLSFSPLSRILLRQNVTVRMANGQNGVLVFRKTACLCSKVSESCTVNKNTALLPSDRKRQMTLISRGDEQNVPNTFFIVTVVLFKPHHAKGVIHPV